jgi:uncharacterized membrane protein
MRRTPAEGPHSRTHVAVTAVRAVEPRFIHHGTFGNDRFGVLAERFARFFGTPRFIIGQTVLVAAWIACNAAAFSFRWDPYPFILLNLAFSTQAAYAAPLILLAQTRQAERDKLRDLSIAEHHDAETQSQRVRGSAVRAARPHPEGIRTASADARPEHQAD